MFIIWNWHLIQKWDNYKILIHFTVIIIINPLHVNIKLFSWKIVTKNSQSPIRYPVTLASPNFNQASLFSRGSWILACLQVWAQIEALGCRPFPLNSSFWELATVSAHQPAFPRTVPASPASPSLCGEHFFFLFDFETLASLKVKAFPSLS